MTELRVPGAAGAVALLAGIALFGNGLKAVVTSTVLVSQAQFAAYLQMPAPRVAVLMEAVIAGMVVALAACPLLLRRASARAVAMVACLVAAASFAAFAAVDLAQPAAWVRETAAFAGFGAGAAALALLAPTAQSLVTLAPAARGALTGVWTGATPAGFLVAPQMVKVLLPAWGLAYYFLAFAALPLALFALLLALAAVLPAARAVDPSAPTLPTRLLLAFVAMVIAFEIWSTLGSVTGYRTPATIAGLALCVGAGAWLFAEARRTPVPASFPHASAWLLGALFVLEMPTTGFFDTTFLVERHVAEDFIADRSTLAAAAQIAGTLAALFLAHRFPAAERALRYGFAALAVAGLAAIAGYPWFAAPAYLLWTPALEGFGAAGLTLLVCLAAVRGAAAHPLLAALPSIAIMLGTEVGLEMLQLVLAIADTLGATGDVAFGALFGAQVVIALAAVALLARAGRG